jgi:hypothetical protein
MNRENMKYLLLISSRGSRSPEKSINGKHDESGPDVRIIALFRNYHKILNHYQNAYHNECKT